MIDLNPYQMMFDVLKAMWLIFTTPPIGTIILLALAFGFLRFLYSVIRDKIIRANNGRIQKELNERAKKAGVADTDNMTGRQFEIWLKHYFERLGYNVHLLQGYKDKGADLILRKNGIKIAVQAKKRKSQNVRSFAVGDLLRAMRYYECSKGYLVTNQYFTQDTIEEVEDYDDIELWDRTRLVEEIEKHRNKLVLSKRASLSESSTSGNKSKKVSVKKPVNTPNKPINKGF